MNKKTSDLEYSIINKLKRRKIIQNSEPGFLIFNHNLECPLDVKENSKCIHKKLQDLDYPLEPKMSFIDLYFDTPQKDFFQDKILCRFRYYYNHEEKMVSSRYICVRSLKQVLLKRKYFFKEEFIVVKRTDDLEAIANLTEAFYEKILDGYFQVTGFVYKKRTSYQIKPWHHLKTPMGDFVMNDHWVRLFFDQVKMIQYKKLREHEFHTYLNIPRLIIDGNPLSEIYEQYFSHLPEIPIIEIQSALSSQSKNLAITILKKIGEKLTVSYRPQRKGEILISQI